MLEGLGILGCALLGGAFVLAGGRNILNAALLTSIMSARGVPLPRAALWVGIVLQIVAGLLVAFGLWRPVAAVVLVIFLVLATLMFHNFWNHQGADRAAKINGVIGNVALIGGFFAIM